MTENPLPADFAADFAPEGAEPPIIRVSDVSFTYDGETLALSGASVRIARGEFVCVLGGNGSGKSTLAKHLNALLVPDKGQVEVCGMDTSEREHTYAIRQSAGMVFQNPDDQLVASLVEDDVAFGPENLGVPTAELRKRVTQRLQDVGLSGFEKHETHALSGGQKQRVAIAGALAMNPEILILDEASAMLDPRGRKGLMRVVRSLNDQGMTVVMITHFMEEAALADRIIVLDGGKVARRHARGSAYRRRCAFGPQSGGPLRSRAFPGATPSRGARIAAVTEEALAESVFSVFHLTQLPQAVRTRMQRPKAHREQKLSLRKRPHRLLHPKRTQPQERPTARSSPLLPQSPQTAMCSSGWKTYRSPTTPPRRADSAKQAKNLHLSRRNGETPPRRSGRSTTFPSRCAKASS